jgi:hypothetical protein
VRRSNWIVRIFRKKKKKEEEEEEEGWTRWRNEQQTGQADSFIISPHKQAP